MSKVIEFLIIILCIALACGIVCKLVKSENNKNKKDK